ncbi:HAMP domain-containing histidine kinase [Candidatus Binatia bacterium]|nr:HAMP domain-containing histidine kinase [Candidatus Binatia bacterium]
MWRATVRQMLSDRERLRWAVRVRWLVIGGCLGLAVGAGAVGAAVPLRLCVVVALIGALMNGLNGWSVRRGWGVGVVTAVAVPLDQVLITTVVLATGGTRSPFVTMYVVQVLATAMLVGTWPAAASAAFGMSIWGVGAALLASGAGSDWSGALALGGVPFRAPGYEAVWGAYLLYCLGLLVYLGGYVAARLRRSEEDLAAKNRSLAAALASLTVAHSALRDSYAQLARTEAQLVQSEKMRSIGQLVAGVAHELNNPLAFVVANIAHLREAVGRLHGALMADEAAAADPASRAALAAVRAEWRVAETVAELGGVLDDCREGARRAARIVGDLRAFARSDERTALRAADLHRGLDSTVALLAHRWVGHITVHRAYGTIPLVACRPDQINQVFMNLLVNAADAIGDGPGNVWISTRLVPAADGERTRVAVAVRDDGPGMPDATRARVFEPFFTTKPVGRGTGLGLSVSYGIARRHGGTITVEAAPGAGATFTLYVPVAGPDAQRAAQPTGVAV